MPGSPEGYKPEAHDAKKQVPQTAVEANKDQVSDESDVQVDHSSTQVPYSDRFEPEELADQFVSMPDKWR